MKIGIFTALFSDRSLEEALDIIKAEGIQAVELGAGAYPGNAHCNAADLVDNKAGQKKLMAAITSRGLELSALSVHGNPLHPDKKIADAHHTDFVNAVKLAGQLGVSCVNGFSGCPGDGPRAKNPNWVTCAWPDEFRAILDWQWKKKFIP